MAEKYNNDIVDKARKFSHLICISVLSPFLLGSAICVVYGFDQSIVFDLYQVRYEVHIFWLILFQTYIKISFIFFNFQRSPFTISNVILYFLFYIPQCMNVMIFMLLFTVVVSLCIGLFRYISAYFDILKIEAMEINRIDFSKMESYLKLRIGMTSIIELHIQIFHLMDNVQDILSGIFFKQLCSYAIFIGNSLNSKASGKSNHNI